MLSFTSMNYIVATSDRSQHFRQEKIVRPLANFPEKISAAPFISYNLDKKVCETYTKDVEKLKEEVRERIVDTKTKTADKLNLIDNVERLGVYYYFDKEIDEQLHLISSKKGLTEGYSDLSTVALGFRLFRQHGLPITSDIFDQFTNGNGTFKNSLKNNIKGLLNLYEASYVRTHRDCILDEALMFTRNQLNSSEAEPSCPVLESQVKHALLQSIHRSIPRFEARRFISVYEEDKLKNVSLLRLAKLEFNFTQLLHRQELSTAQRWWKELDMPSKLPYGRDRLVECYFFALAMLFEPQYSDDRIVMAKYFAIITFIDDTYDAYGTLEELEIFTAAIERWDVSARDGLPEYMKILYDALLNFHDELHQYAVRKGRPYASHHLKEAWKEYARNTMIQSKWLMNKEEPLPPFSDYLSNGLRLAGVRVTVANAYLTGGSSESVFDWIAQHPPLLIAAETVCRLQNDVASHQFERERGTATPIDIYMKNYNVSEEEAKKKVMEMVEDAWKGVNEEYHILQQTKMMKRKDIEPILNLPRIINFAYMNNIDGWTDTPKSVKPYINKVLLEPLPL